ncbi:AbiV family abortive infection protein [Kocuria sp. M4R2S49]|uniref:AbiV family abortive infection protein n=1 Tax=Kocuria rhizosphaericola TaxID=3376284 RepID=UPI0037B1AF82
MTEMSAVEARTFWKALVDNASALISDAHVLLAAESYGRARSLTVLAQEELGKALWIYETSKQAWSEGDDTPRVVNALKQYGRDHTKKYLEAVVFGTAAPMGDVRSRVGYCDSLVPGVVPITPW